MAKKAKEEGKVFPPVRVLTSEEKATLHFQKVCAHGVPHGYKCQTCDKVIKIPDDAVIKPEGFEKKEE